ncbi:hypothetical protein [Dictyobacter aurantiacus]|uniref:Uncharacterized protein n=1 Tax=Dictyobacter aurantiacus TaxID=1936993 RepID=A0A401ZJI5_9CHLR|nr:hypothetical protein [Dictyobacter aurantiacus]GCE07025.1 hypothetical protein KDAU_43540 [Dictyobacter aurantiacus]
MSEVAMLRKRIEMECEAMSRAMSGFRVTAPHEVINHGYNALGDLREQLAAIVGEHEATRIAVDMYIQVLG